MREQSELSIGSGLGRTGIAVLGSRLWLCSARSSGRNGLGLFDRATPGRCFGDAVQLIHELNQTRDRGLYREVGKLTRELHSAIVNFHIDPSMPQAEEVSQITDATERLAYVVKLTEAAANRTMDLVENSTVSA